MTPSSSHLLPGPAGAIVARLPAYPGSVLLARLLNRLLLPRFPADVSAILANRGLRIAVRGARLQFDLRQWAPDKVWVRLVPSTRHDSEHHHTGAP